MACFAFSLGIILVFYCSEETPWPRHGGLVLGVTYSLGWLGHYCHGGKHTSESFICLLHRQRERQADREKIEWGERKTDRQTDTETDRKRDTEREKERNWVCLMWIFWNLEAHTQRHISNKTAPLILLKQDVNWGQVVQTYEPMGIILIQTTLGLKACFTTPASFRFLLLW